jgi:hypothetical protein
MTRIKDTLQTDSHKVELYKSYELLQDIKWSETLWTLMGTLSVNCYTVRMSVSESKPSVRVTPK